jgi:hypothetical protein
VVLYAPSPRQASIATFLSDFRPNCVLVFAFVCLYLFPYICFWFSLYLLLFSATSVVFFCFVFPYCFFACFLVCLQFCSFSRSSPCLFRSPSFIVGAFFRAPTAMTFQRYLHCPGLACTRSAFISLYFYCFLLVISPILIGLLLGVMLDPDLWVVDVNIFLAFRLRRTSVGLRFSTLNAKE